MSGSGGSARGGDSAAGGDFAPEDAGIAPPMRNGEVVFEAPWQGRAFGMARAMSDAGVFAWDEFRAQLIEELSKAEATRAPFDYYRSFLTALERLVTDRGLLSARALDARLETLRRRAPGHDHRHEHGDG